MAGLPLQSGCLNTNHKAYKFMLFIAFIIFLLKYNFLTVHWLPEFACNQSKHCIQRVFLKIKLQSLQIPLHCEADFVYSSLKIWYFTLWPMYVFKITLNVFKKKKKGWSYKQVISLSHLNNAIFFYRISLFLSPLSSMACRQTYISTISQNNSNYWDRPTMYLQ